MGSSNQSRANSERAAGADIGRFVRRQRRSTSARRAMPRFHRADDRTTKTRRDAVLASLLICLFTSEDRLLFLRGLLGCLLCGCSLFLCCGFLGCHFFYSPFRDQEIALSECISSSHRQVKKKVDMSVLSSHC